MSDADKCWSKYMSQCSSRPKSEPKSGPENELRGVGENIKNYKQ